VQVDPIKPALEVPGTKRLKPIYDVPLSNFAFKFNLRRYLKAQLMLRDRGAHLGSMDVSVRLCEAGAGNCLVGFEVSGFRFQQTLSLCRSTASNLVFKAPGTKRLKL